MHASGVAPVSDKGRMILVVDDEPFILQYVGQVLRHANYQVATAANGDQAWSIILGTEGINLLLTDIVMPGSMDGLELATKIRERNLNIPVLFITGAVPEGDDRTAKLARNEILLKPFFPKQLLDFVGTRFTLSSS